MPVFAAESSVFWVVLCVGVLRTVCFNTGSVCFGVTTISLGVVGVFDGPGSGVQTLGVDGGTAIILVVLEGPGSGLVWYNPPQTGVLCY